jgi:WD40 repeat protein
VSVHRNILRLWDAESGKLVREIIGRGVPADTLALGVSGDEKFAITGGAGGIIRLWDLESGKHIETLRDKHEP